MLVVLYLYILSHLQQINCVINTKQQYILSIEVQDVLKNSWTGLHFILVRVVAKVNVLVEVQ